MNGDNEQIRIISDEMNLAEFPLNSLGERVPKGVTELVFEDVVEDRATGDTHPTKITVRGQGPFGLPTSTDDEVLMACLVATKKAGFKSRKVHFQPCKMLREMRWSSTGTSYANLKRGLDRYSTISVVSEGAYWHNGKKKPLRDIVGILDRWQASGIDEVTGVPEDAYFVWGDFMWQSFKAGNLRNMDYKFWLDLESAVARRAYRFLGKQFYRRDAVTYSLKPYAVNKLGMSATNPNTEIKRTLKKAHAELEKKGFCRAEYAGHGKNTKVIYTSLAAKDEAVADPLFLALKNRRVGNPKAILDSGVSRKRIEEAIRNYDHRREMGEKVGPGWLRDNLASEAPYDFRKDFVSEESKEEARKRKRRGEEKKRAVYSKVLKESEEQLRAKHDAFRLYFESLSIEEQQSFRTEAISQSKANRDYLRNADPIKSPMYPARLEQTLVEHWQKRMKAIQMGKLAEH